MQSEVCDTGVVYCAVMGEKVKACKILTENFMNGDLLGYLGMYGAIVRTYSLEKECVRTCTVYSCLCDRILWSQHSACVL
jgi:hypothetical protein